MSLNTTSTLSTQYQKHFEPLLLQHAIQELRLNEFGKAPTEMPKNRGTKQVSWMRRVAASSTNVLTLTEGVAPATTTDVTYTEVSVTLGQIGEVAKFTDVLSWTQLYNSLKDGIALMGEDCALKADDVTRNAIIAGVTTAGQKRYPIGLANFAALSAATASAGKVSAVDFLDAVTKLKINRSPKIGGYYVAIIPPQVSRDVMNDNDWLEAAKYSSAEQLYKGELGRLHGARFVEATNPFIEDEAEGTFDAVDDDSDGLIYPTIITGREAYGVAKLGSGFMKPEIIICDKADKSDPLNQTLTAGWKGYYAAKVLNENYMVVLRSKTEFAG